MLLSVLQNITETIRFQQEISLQNYFLNKGITTQWAINLNMNYIEKQPGNKIS